MFNLSCKSELKVKLDDSNVEVDEEIEDRESPLIEDKKLESFEINFDPKDGAKDLPASPAKLPIPDFEGVLAILLSPMLADLLEPLDIFLKGG